MANREVIRSVKRYLKAVVQKGIPIKYGVLFGSYARGQEHEWSDIDLLVISPHFDKKFKRKNIDLLWHVAAEIDSRIEPIPVGEKQYRENNDSYILVEARRDGMLIPLAK